MNQQAGALRDGTAGEAFPDLRGLRPFGSQPVGSWEADTLAPHARFFPYGLRKHHMRPKDAYVQACQAAGDGVVALPHALRTPRSPTTKHMFIRVLILWFDFPAGQAVEQLEEVIAVCFKASAAARR